MCSRYTVKFNNWMQTYNFIMQIEVLKELQTVLQSATHKLESALLIIKKVTSINTIIRLMLLV